MRASFFVLAFASIALGCGPGSDPNLGDCAGRKPGVVTVGTGEESFVPVGAAGVKINVGGQGGRHIWLGLACQNLGPRVIAHFKITDVATGIELSQSNLQEVVELEFDGKASDLASGIYGYLADRSFDEGAGGGAPQLPNDLTGRKIKIEADVTDSCDKPPVHAEAVTVISAG